MKKILLLALATLALASCDSGAKNGKYTRVHIEATGGVPIHCQVLDFGTLVHSYNTMLEVKTLEYGWIAVDSKNFILYQTDKCPICNK